jgi:hypothetical protein
MSRVTRSGGVIAACMLTLAAEGAAADIGCAPALPLVWIDGNTTAPGVLDEAEREASRIWQAAGIHLDWARSGPSRAIRQDEILVVLRSELVVRTATEGRARRRQPLGRLIRASADRPGRLIELALPDIVRSVGPQSLHGHRIRDLPQIARDRVIGRALGRVVAHEIGHWLFGRDHANDGLMRAAIGRPALVAADPPPLPAAWPSTARARLRAHRPCPPPPAHHGAPS